MCCVNLLYSPSYSEPDPACSIAFASHFLLHNETRRVTACPWHDQLITSSFDPFCVCFYSNDYAILGHEEVEAKFGVRPSSLPDLFGLVGDVADNIPGDETSDHLSSAYWS